MMDAYRSTRESAVVHLLQAGRALELDPGLEAQRAARWCFRWASRVRTDTMMMPTFRTWTPGKAHDCPECGDVGTFLIGGAEILWKPGCRCEAWSI